MFVYVSLVSCFETKTYAKTRNCKSWCLSQELFETRTTQGLGTANAGVFLRSCFETKTYSTTKNRYAYEKPLYKLGLQLRQCPLLTQTSEREINQYRRLWSVTCWKGKSCTESGCKCVWTSNEPNVQVY